MAAKKMETKDGKTIEEYIGVYADMAATIDSSLAPGSVYWVTDDNETKGGWIYDGAAYSKLA